MKNTMVIKLGLTSKERGWERHLSYTIGTKTQIRRKRACLDKTWGIWTTGHEGGSSPKEDDADWEPLLPHLWALV